jgi:hypothetical protein
MKKNYNKPELRFVKLRSRVSILAGSVPSGGGDDGGQFSGARRASFSTFEGEE